jgi:hypothetical protein
VQEHRFTTLLNGKPAEPGRIHAWGTEQLGRHTDVVQLVRVLAKAKGNPDFFVPYRRVVRRERGMQVTPVM